MTDEATEKRRFEFVGGRSRKFWEVWTVGAVMHARWGRLGTSGQSKTWEYGSLAAARSMASRKANEKLAKGYIEVGVPMRSPIIEPVAAEKPKTKTKKRKQPAVVQPRRVKQRRVEA